MAKSSGSTRAGSSSSPRGGGKSEYGRVLGLVNESNKAYAAWQKAENAYFKASTNSPYIAGTKQNVDYFKKVESMQKEARRLQNVYEEKRSAVSANYWKNKKLTDAQKAKIANKIKGA